MKHNVMCRITNSTKLKAALQMPLSRSSAEKSDGLTLSGICNAAHNTGQFAIVQINLD